MKTPFFLVVVLGFVLPASAQEIKAIIAKPTADNPRFDNREAWPMLVGDEYFLTQKWEEGRTYIWNVRKSIDANIQSGRGRGLDWSDPSNWIDAATGKPATELPDMDTDLILPDSDTPYKAALCDEDTKGAFCRHLTIGKNAAFSSWGARHHRFRLFGNLWIRPGGSMRTGQGSLVFTGDKHTFLRYDWPEDGESRLGRSRGRRGHWRNAGPAAQARRLHGPWIPQLAEPASPRTRKQETETASRRSTRPATQRSSSKHASCRFR